MDMWLNLAVMQSNQDACRRMGVRFEDGAGCERRLQGRHLPQQPVIANEARTVNLG